MKKIKLLSATALLLCTAGAWAQEWSGDITNADGLAFTKQYVGMSDGDVAETWKNSIETTDGFDLNQSLTSVPDGVYELSAQAMYRASLTYGTATNCVLYATVGGNTFSTPIANFGDYTSKEDRTATGGIATQMQNNNAYLNVVPAVIVEGGNVTIGMKSVGELAYCTNGYWFVFKKSTFTFKNVTSTYHAKLITRATTILATAPESSAKNTLSDALTTYATANFANVKALQAAIDTFLETANVENPLNVTDYITNPSFADDSGNKKNWIQDLGYKQPSDIYQPTGWNMLYSSAKVNNTQYQTYKTQTDNAKDNNCYYVRQRWGDVYAVVDLHQLVKELPAGAYRLTVSVKGGSSVTDANSLKMVAGANSNTTTVDDFDKSNYKDYSVQVIKADANTDIDISFGWNQTSGGEQLYYVDDFRLYYLGDPVKAKKNELEALQATIDDTYLDAATYANVVGTERTTLSDAKSITAASETVEAYETAITSVQNAIDAFTAAKANYDALVVEIAKAKALGIADATADDYAATSSSTAATALTNTQNLKVAEYNLVNTTYQYGVELGAWTTTGPTGSLSDQHYKGSGNPYLEQSSAAWSSSSWTIKYDQNVTLPAGSYVFKVAGRQADSDGVTLSLTVKNGETTLGTVSDFPRGDTGLGINTSGATDYTTGEGHEYVNGGVGRGWEWRFVKFTLADDATVNVAVDAVATTSHMWVSFCDASVLTDNEANISLIAYNIALGSARTIIADDTYENVTGDEKTALQNAIDADDTLDKTDKDDIDAATTALDNARKAFVAAKGAYDAFVAAKAVEYEDNLPYASSTKFAAIATAQGAADATSASDATTKTNAILSAYRQYVESNAMAEGVTGAEDKTTLIGNPNFADVTIDGTSAGAWTFDQTGGSVNINTSEPFTDGAGSSSYSYFDYYNGSNNNQNIHQIISNLAPGRYLLTVTGRGHTNFNNNLQLYVVGKGSVNIPCVGNSGGVFDRGWNDVSLVFDQLETSDITIGAKTNNSQPQWWGVTRFRLVKLPCVVINEGVDYTPEATTTDVMVKRTIKADTWNTFVVPFDITNEELVAKFGEEVAVAEFSDAGASADAVTVSFTKMATPAISANTPVLLKGSAGTSYSFTGRTIETGTPTVEGTYLDFVGTYAASTIIASGDFFISANKLYKSSGATTIQGTRAYLHAKSAGVKAMLFIDDEATSIDAINGVEAENGVIYNIAGQRLNKMQKGINIVNGKKVLY